jgi:hypothetical protein
MFVDTVRARAGDADLLDRIEGRRVKDSRLELILNEPLAFHAAGPRPRGRVSDYEAHDHHAPTAAAQLHPVAAKGSLGRIQRFAP